jgi:amino acid transporter
MFEELLPRAEVREARRPGVKHPIVWLPPAFSAFCLLTFLGAGLINWDHGAEGVVLLWKIGMLFVTGAVSLFFIRKHRFGLAVLTWPYSAAVAGITLIFGTLALALLFGM